MAVPLADQVWGIGDTAFDAADWGDVAAAVDAGDRQDPKGDASPQDPPVRAAQPPAVAAPEPPQNADALTAVAQQAQDEERRRAEARLRNAFGDAILINDDGTITKQYFLSRDSGSVFLNLLLPLGEARPKEVPVPAPKTRFGGDAQDSVLGKMLGADHEVEIVYLPDFEQFSNMGVRTKGGQQAMPTGQATTNSLLLVTARPEALNAFESALNLFYANIPQVEIDVKVVEYARTDTLSFGVTPIDENTPILQNLNSGALIQQITSSFPLTTLGTNINDKGLIALGGIHSSWELNAALELLEANNVADIRSQPRMVVRNGGLATVTTTTAQPFPEAKITNQTVTSTNVAFKDVGIVMDIRPEIAGTETVVLNIFISVSAITGFAATDPVPTPIVSTREAATSVHLKEGESTVIGGLISEAQLDLETKIPILGDIPILGYLFRSTTTQQQKTTLEFHITPRILIGPRGSRASPGL